MSACSPPGDSLGRLALLDDARSIESAHSAEVVAMTLRKEEQFSVYPAVSL